MTASLCSRIGIVLLIFGFVQTVDARGASGSIDQALEETYWMGAVGNRKAADNLFRGAINDAQRGLSSFPPNVGLLVRAAKQGVRGYDADQQSRSQARWAMKAIDSESSANRNGFQSDRGFGKEQLKQLANTKSPYKGFIKDKLGHLGIQVDENRSVLSGPGGVEVPLGLSNEQMSERLGQESNSNIAAVLRYGAEKVFGVKNVPGLTDGVAGWIKGQVQGLLTSDDGAVNQAVQLAMQEARAEMENSRRNRKPGEMPETAIADNYGADEQAVQAAADGEAEDTFSELPPVEENEAIESEYDRTPASYAYEQPAQAKERIGLMSFNIFNMISRRYAALNAQNRLINDDSKY